MTFDEYFETKRKMYEFERQVLRAWGEIREFDTREIAEFEFKEELGYPENDIMLCGVTACTVYRTDFIPRSIIELGLEGKVELAKNELKGDSK